MWQAGRIIARAARAKSLYFEDRLKYAVISMNKMEASPENIIDIWRVIGYTDEAV
jgi:hypothetical protein